MSPGFSDDFKEQVRARTDLVHLIGETVSLQPKRGGREFVGLCPFHDDRNPSLTVAPERQTYKCWSCGEGGDCFTFVMKIDALGFPEALESLARRAGLEVPTRARAPKSNASGEDKATLYEILGWAEREFHHCLKTSPAAEEARNYLAARGFSAETIDTFRIGYHPAGWEWLQQRARGKYSVAQLFAARLVRQRDGRDGHYDAFRERVLFPIHDIQGRAVAFGGRVLPGYDGPETGKYQNSDESELFAKSRLLYGFDIAKESIRKSRSAVVVEGYTDCTLAHQFGLTNVVATLGTALTESHVANLKRFARTVTLVFDGDDAGRKAAERSIAAFLAQELDLRILTLPGNLDPADFLAAHGVEAWENIAIAAPEALEFKLRAAIAKYGLDTVDSRQQVMDDMLQLLAQAPGLTRTAREDLILARLAQRLLLDERVVRNRLKEIRDKTAAKPQANKPVRVDGRHPEANEKFFTGAGGQPTRDELLECELLEILLTDPTTAQTLKFEVAPEEFGNEHLGRLLLFCYDLAERGIEPSFDAVMAALEDPAMKRLGALIGDWALDKDIAGKLREAEPRSDRTAATGLLRTALELFARRRKERLHAQLKGQRAQQSVSAGNLDAEALDRLRREAEFHRARATNNTH
ncbi:MAG: DNA primase [Planctomycetaceae bacterium]